jgi:hypothetical protein
LLQYKPNNFLKKSLTQSLLILSLTACGGGGESNSAPDIPTNISPIANAGSDITIQEQEEVSIQGSGTDSDGSISSYSWTQSGGTSVTLSGGNTSTISFFSPDIVNDETLTFTLTVTDDDGSTGSNSVSVTVIHINAAPTISAGDDSEAMEGDTVTLIGTSSDIDSSNLTYSWVQTSGASVTIENSDSLTASFDSLDINQEETLSFEVTVNDNAGAENSIATDSVEVSIKPYDIAFNLPTTVGNGCEFSVELIDTYAIGIDSITWHVLSDTNELIVEGDAIENNSITTTIPDSGDYSLSATTIFTNGLTSEISNAFVVNKALPKDVKSIDYVISSNQSQVVCHDVNIWNDATLKLEEGASLSSIDDTSKKIFMWGDVNVLGTETNRISISNVVFQNDFLNTDSTITINASYVDFINEATISNYDGTTNISYSTFDSHFNQEDEGTVIYNVFNKGFSTKPDGTIIKHNDIYCEGLSSCMYVSNYMFGSGYLSAKPTIEYNNIFDAANGSITYNNDSFTDGDIDLRNNYWGGKTLAELNDVFIDANDTPDKAYVFLFDPMLEVIAEHTNVAPIATAYVGIEYNNYDTMNPTSVRNFGTSIYGSQSYDSNGDELSYQWTVTSKPAGSLTSINANTDSDTLFTADITGEYVLELKVSDGMLESNSYVTINIIEDYTITHAPVTPNVTLTMCAVTGTGNYSGYIWSFNNCTPYGYADNLVGVKIRNNHPSESIIIKKVGFEINNNTSFELNINHSSQTVNPSNYMYFKLTMPIEGNVTGGFFQLDNETEFSDGIQAVTTFSQ